MAKDQELTLAYLIGVICVCNLVAFYEDDMSSFLLISLNIIYLASGGLNSIIFPCCPLGFSYRRFLHCRDVKNKIFYYTKSKIVEYRRPGNSCCRITSAGWRIAQGVWSASCGPKQKRSTKRRGKDPLQALRVKMTC